jgi:hypothetical protein
MQQLQASINFDSAYLPHLAPATPATSLNKKTLRNGNLDSTTNQKNDDE